MYEGWRHYRFLKSHPAPDHQLSEVEPSPATHTVIPHETFPPQIQQKIGPFQSIMLKKPSSQGKLSAVRRICQQSLYPGSGMGIPWMSPPCSLYIGVSVLTGSLVISLDMAHLGHAKCSLQFMFCYFVFWCFFSSWAILSLATLC